MNGVFARWQPRYAEHGIPTFPVSIEGVDKKPAVRGYLKLGIAYSHQLALKFPANDAFGFTLGKRTRITVLDIDSPDEHIRDAAFARHGEPVIVVRTLQGRWQGWYRHNGERRRIRPWPGQPVDVLGGGFVCAPPSQGPRSRYAFVQGRLDDLDRLTPLRNLDLPNSPPVSRDRIPEGQRNEALWRYCMRQAGHCDDPDALQDVARTFSNSALAMPLPDAEIERAAKSAWKYEISGRNQFGRGGTAILDHSSIDALTTDADALALYVVLCRHHAPGSEFILANAMASETFRWTLRRFKAAVRRLVKERLLICLHPGGRGAGDPPRYRLLRTS